MAGPEVILIPPTVTMVDLVVMHGLAVMAMAGTVETVPVEAMAAPAVMAPAQATVEMAGMAVVVTSTTRTVAAEVMVGMLAAIVARAAPAAMAEPADQTAAEALAGMEATDPEMVTGAMAVPEVAQAMVAVTAA